MTDTTKRPGHGLDEYVAMLKAIDGKTIRITAERPAQAADDAEFDHRVRRSLDRQHRRQRISQ